MPRTDINKLPKRKTNTLELKDGSEYIQSLARYYEKEKEDAKKSSDI